MNSDSRRPVIEVPASPLDLAVEALTLVGLALMLVLVVTSLPVLPDRIPTHFDAVGVPDGWGPKSTLWVLPGLSAFMYVLLTIVNLFPQAFNLPVAITQENAPRQYAIAKSAMRWLKMEMVWLFAYIEWATVQTALGRARGIHSWALPLILVLVFGTIAVLVVKSYRAR